MHKLVRVRQNVILLLSILLAFCLTLGLCFIVPGSAQAEGTRIPAFTYIIGDQGIAPGEGGTFEDAMQDDGDGVIHYRSQSRGWTAAIAKAVELAKSDAENKLVLIKLADNWNAAGGSFGISESTDVTETAYLNGALAVPSGTEVEFDLFGNVLNRGLSSAVLNGENIVSYGNLKIYDSSAATVTRMFEFDGVDRYVYGSNYNTGDENVVSVSCSGGLITGGYAEGNGAGVRAEGGSLTIDGVLIAGNSSTQSGGGVYVASGCGIVLNDANIAYNNGANGGGLYVSDNQLTVNGGAVSNNRANISGGGLYAGAGSKVIINGCTVSNNTANMRGGIYSAGSLEMTESTVSGNTASGMSGGIGASRLILKNSTVSGNSATTAGGIYCTDETIIDNCRILNNTATAGAGGGIYSNGNITIKNGTEISENTSVSLGGGAYIENSKGIFENITISKNSATGNGGGLYHLSEVELNNVTIVGNSTQASGGGVYNASSDLIILGNTSVTANTATEFGAGVYVMNSLQASGNINITGNKQGGNVVEKEDGSIVAEDGALNNVYLTGPRKLIPYTATGVLSEDSQIGVTPYSASEFENLVITNGYGDKYIDGADVTDPASIFVCDLYGTDNNYVTVLNSEGEVRFIRLLDGDTVKWSVKYESDPVDQETVVDGYGLSFNYGENVLASVKLNDQELLTTGFLFNVMRRDGKVTAHEVTGTLTYGLDSVSVSFYVYIAPKALSADDVSIDETDLKFNGEAKTPVVVNDGENVLMAGTDYNVEYINNVNAGTATAVVTGTGNYSGSIETSFVIVKDDSATYSVNWEYFNGEEWSAISASTAFTFNNKTHDYSVRGVLTVGEYVEHVYAENYAGDDQLVNPNLYLVFAGTFDGAAVNSLLNAATYTITISGDGNATLPANTRSTVVINPITLNISEDNFANYEDSVNGNRLWQLSFNDTHTRLRDSGTTYYDPDAANNVTVGTLNDAYARYNGNTLTLTLNGAYAVGGGTLADYLEIATVTYTGNASAGVNGAVTAVNTSVTLTFNGNYSVRSVTLNKTWYIVNINNALRRALQHDDASISGWTFGSNPNAEVLRPEHGDYAIYTIGLVGGTALETFAVTFNGTEISYYGVKLQNGETVPDTENVYRYNFNEYLSTLAAGSYNLTVYVPEYRVTSSHIHWWDLTPSGEEDENAIYHSITASFAFTVGTYAIASGSGFNSGISYEKVSTTVAYNGKANNTPEVVLSLNGKILTEGVDYELLSDRINVGLSNLTVRGIGSLTGSVTLAGEYNIVKANNGWEVTPNIIRWAYGMYEAEINQIYATPLYLEDGKNVKFSIARDADGINLVEGLEGFASENGVVNADVAQLLSELPAGTYYLVSTVEESENYYELNRQPMEFRVSKATNTWAVTPNVIQWQYNGYDSNTNLFLAQPRSVSDDMVITYKVTSDAAGNTAVSGLGSFTVNDGKVSQAIADILNGLSVGTYYLTVEVTGNDNFTGLKSTVSFDVVQAANAWAATPSIKAWVKGSYNETDNAITAEALFGEIRYVIYLAGDEENIIYDSANGINNLGKANIGTYVLSAYVSDGSVNYTDLSPYMVTFEIFAPEGLPWWAILIIVVGVLGAAALVLYILHEKGILQMLTGKVVIAMRTRATIDATIAAVRANKVAELAKISIAEAEARDAEEARKKQEEQTANEKDVTSEAKPEDEQ